MNYSPFSQAYSQLGTYSAAPTPGAQQTALAQSASMQGGDTPATGDWSGVGTAPPAPQQGASPGDAATNAGLGLAKAGIGALAKEGIGSAAEAAGIGGETLGVAGGALSGIGGIVGPALSFANGQYGAGAGAMMGAMVGTMILPGIGTILGGILGSAAGSMLPWGPEKPRPEDFGGASSIGPHGEMGAYSDSFKNAMTGDPNSKVFNQLVSPEIARQYQLHPELAGYGGGLSFGYESTRPNNKYSIATTGGVNLNDGSMSGGARAFFDPNDQKSFADAMNVIVPDMQRLAGPQSNPERVNAAVQKQMGDALTQDAERYSAASGGLVRNYARGGIVGFIDHDTPGRADKVKAEVVHGTYIFPADIVSGLGEGNSLAGRKQLDAMIAKIPEIPVGHARGGIVGSQKIPVALSGGEYAAPPKVAYHLGQGDVERGADELDKRVVHTRHLLTQHQARLPGPKR